MSKQGRSRKKGKGKQQCVVPAKPSPSVLQIQGMYSDLLYQPHFCATVDLAPEWLQTDNIDRRSGLSVQDFVRQYEQPNRPVVITDAASRQAVVWRCSFNAEGF